MNLSNDTPIARAISWIAKNELAFNILGIFFFVLMSVGLGFWIAGKDAEPITFAFSFLTSLAFAIVPAAKRLTEARPLDRMGYDELMEVILRSQKQDWQSESDSGVEEYFYLRDTRLRIKSFNDERGIQSDDFKENWANKFPDSHAKGYWYDLYYSGERIKRILLVSVDGNRALIPCPKLGTTDIREFDDKVATIVNTDLSEYIEYLKRAGLKNS